jgi:hypothetical protein
LLRSAGHPARLARAALPAGRAEELAAKVRPVPAERFPAAAEEPALDQEIARYAQRYGLDADELREHLGRATVQGGRLAEQVLQRTSEQAPVLQAALAQAGAAAKPKQAPADAAGAPARAAAALRDHWWVQVQSPSGWGDLDPLLPDAAPGAAAAAAEATFPLGTDAAKLPLDASVCHEVEIRVVAEKSEGGKRQEKRALVAALRPAELYGQDVVLSFLPLNWPDDLDSRKAAGAAKFRETVLKQKEWLPTLYVGKSRNAKASIKDSGDVDESPDVEGAAKIGQGAAKAIGGFGAALGGGGESEPALTSHLTAVWVEYEIRSPGVPPRTVRRDVVDLIGAAARAGSAAAAAAPTEAQRLTRGLALMGRVEVQVLGSRITGQYVEHLTSTRALANRSAYSRLMREPWTSPKDLVNKLDKAEPMPGPLYGLAIARDAFSPRQADVYLDRPNVLTAVFRPKDLAAEGMVVCAGFDIVANEVAVRPGAQGDEFSVRLAQGVADTNAEAALVGGCGAVQNAAEAFAVAAPAGAEWLVVSAADQAAWKGVEIPAEVRARVDRDLADGYVVVVPKRTARVQDQAVAAYWRVDPATGSTLGIGHTGAGQAMVDYVVSVTWGAVWAVLCMLIAGSDADGVTTKDALACTAVAVSGGGALVPAVATWTGVGAVMLLATVAAVFTGLDKNKDVSDD